MISKKSVWIRRGALLLNAVLLLVLGVVIILKWKDISGTGEKPPEFCLAVAADIHYLAEELTDGGPYFQAVAKGGDGKQLLYQKEIVAAFLRDMEELRPDAVLLAGDLTLNGERASHEQVAALFEGLVDEGIPVYVIPGNHDIANLFARRYVGETAEFVENAMTQEFLAIYGRLGYGAETEGVTDRSPDGLSYLVRFEGISLYLLNTNRFQEQGYLIGNEIAHDTLVWMYDHLAEDAEAGRTPIAAGHHNLLVHNPLFVEGYTLSNSTEVKNMFAMRGVPLYLSGHMHIQHEAKEMVEIGGKEHTLWDAAGSSLMVNPHQYGLVTVSEDGNIQYETRTVQVERYAREQGATDENLLHFTEYAKEFYYRNSYEKALRSLSELRLDGKRTEQMADFAARVNVDYFAGMDEVRKEQYRKEEAGTFWQGDAGDSFWGPYLDSMLE